ncbi:plasmid replication protein, partial [Clostridium perfringens]|nr:plasmid replication protein [Clostridium perfringens]
DSILNGVTNNYRNITERFLDNYILKAIENARFKAIKTWNNLNRKQGVQANFTQRDYDWNALEEALLSHY